MGIGAGAASTMLLLAAAYGPSGAILLVIFAGLPILIAAIGGSMVALYKPDAPAKPAAAKVEQAAKP